MTESEIEKIHEEGQEAARDSWIGRMIENPYPEGSRRAEIWDYAFRNQFAEDNH